MSISELFRVPKNFKLKDGDAEKRLLPQTESANKDQAKARDKLLTMKLAEQIAHYQEIMYAQRQHKLLIVLQGMDTSGKDGTVRGVFGQTNLIGVRAKSFKVPSATELEHDYLWRIHQQVPAVGELVVFNRSHYEDVLITRVHDLIDQKEAARRYVQICDFERMLAETGTIILKFFLHISKAEQKRRLEQRLADATKHWKFDPSDLAERKYWDAYQEVYQKAIVATDCEQAPWFIIPADSKTQRNLAIAHIVNEKLDSLNMAFPPGKPELFKLKVE